MDRGTYRDAEGCDGCHVANTVTKRSHWWTRVLRVARLNNWHLFIFVEIAWFVFFFGRFTNATSIIVTALVFTGATYLVFCIPSVIRHAIGWGAVRFTIGLEKHRHLRDAGPSWGLVEGLGREELQYEGHIVRTAMNTRISGWLMRWLYPQIDFKVSNLNHLMRWHAKYRRFSNMLEMWTVSSSAQMDGGVMVAEEAALEIADQFAHFFHFVGCAERGGKEDLNLTELSIIARALYDRITSIADDSEGLGRSKYGQRMKEWCMDLIVSHEATCAVFGERNPFAAFAKLVREMIRADRVQRRARRA